MQTPIHRPENRHARIVAIRKALRQGLLQALKGPPAPATRPPAQFPATGWNAVPTYLHARGRMRANVSTAPPRDGRRAAWHLAGPPLPPPRERVVAPHGPRSGKGAKMSGSGRIRPSGLENRPHAQVAGSESIGI